MKPCPAIDAAVAGGLPQTHQIERINRQIAQLYADRVRLHQKPQQ
jgi:hypothetical protein